nr:hypothetical protein [Tanacetum cinerariifolium]
MPGHRCPNKSLQVVLVGDDEGDIHEDEHDASHVHFDAIEVSLNSVIGFTSPQTMKIYGSIGGLKVVVLIDWVMMGNEKFEQSLGLCKGVVLALPELQIVEDFFPLKLGSTYEKEGLLVEMINLKQQNPQPTTSDINDLLAEFEDVFSLPQGLPPCRGHEHSIILKDGIEPISVRPYRYAQAQKDEIKKLVGDMRMAGVIQPSSSPFLARYCYLRKKMEVGGFM